MTYYPNEVDIYACTLGIDDEEILADILPNLNKPVVKEFYVYGLDTNDGRIAAAWNCPNEQAAEWVYDEAMRQMDVEQLSGQFQYSYIGIAAATAIEYKQRGVRKVGFFKQEDFAFAASLTKKPVLVAKKYHCIANDLTDFMYCAGALLEELSDLDRSSEPTLSAGIPMVQSVATLGDYPAIVQAASGRGNPATVMEAYQASIEEAEEPAVIRTMEYGEKALEQRANEMKPVMDVLERIAGNTNPDKIINRLDSPIPIFKSPNSVTKRATKENGARQPSEPANAVRDACIYDLRKEGKTFSEVCDIINAQFENENLDEKAATEALKRYCERKNISYPYGKRGRKSL